MSLKEQKKLNNETDSDEDNEVQALDKYEHNRKPKINDDLAEATTKNLIYKLEKLSLIE